MIGNKLEPFKFWCQKVLPNVYDDSLSYYEYLCKLNEYLNEVIAQINTLTDNMEDYEADLTATWLETKEYIDNYFNNLDVQQEINNKLDAMAESGELSTLLAPIVGTQIGGVVADQIGATVANQIGDTVANQIDDVVANQIGGVAPSIITNWLDTNVDPVGSAVIVDDSLSITGAAADAKITGEKLTTLDDKTYGNLKTINYKVLNECDYNIDVGNNGNVYSTNSNYSCYYIPVTKGDTIKIGANKYVYIAFFKDNPVTNVGKTISYSETYPNKIYLTQYTDYEYDIPNDTNFVYIQHLVDNNDRTPTFVTINGYNIKKTIIDNVEDVKSISENSSNYISNTQLKTKSLINTNNNSLTLSGVYLGSHFTGTNNLDTYPFVMLNMGQSIQISDYPLFNSRDNDIICVNGTFYALSKITGTNKINIRTSTDFENWTSHEILLDLNYNDVPNNLWACDWFIDGNNVYITGASQYGEIAGKAQCVVFVCEIDLSLFEASEPTYITLDGTTKIDPSVTKINNTYYMVTKDEDTTTIKMWTSDNLLTEWQLYHTFDFINVEAPQLIYDNGTYYLLVDVITNDRTMGMGFSMSSDLTNWTQVSSVTCYNKKTIQILRHGSYRKITDEHCLSILLSKMIPNNTIANTLFMNDNRIGKALNLYSYQKRNISISVFTTYVNRLTEDSEWTFNIQNMTPSNFKIPKLYRLYGVYDTLVNSILTRKSYYMPVNSDTIDNIVLTTPSTGVNRFVIVIKPNIRIASNRMYGECTWEDFEYKDVYVNPTLTNIFTITADGNIALQVNSNDIANVEALENIIETNGLAFAGLRTNNVSYNVDTLVTADVGLSSIELVESSEALFTFYVNNEIKTEVQNIIL